MATQRVVMPKGHMELSIGGNTFKIDETGAFEVPSDAVEFLTTVHGAKLEPGVQQLGANLEVATANVAYTKLMLEEALAVETDAKAKLDGFKAQQKVRDEARLKAAIEKKAADERREKETADALAAASKKR